MNNLIPTHLRDLYKISETHKHFKTARKLEKVIYSTQMKILNIEIFDLHRHIHFLSKELGFLSRNLGDNLPPHIYNTITNRFSDTFYRFRYRLSIEYGKKFAWLEYKNKEFLFKKIKPIRYSCTIKGEDIKFFHKDNMKNVDYPIMEVNLDPKKFVSSKMDPLSHTNSKWFINLTNITIPEKVSNLLQLGGKFGLPIDSFFKKNAIHEFIKDVEFYNRHITEDIKSKIRNITIPFFHRLIHNRNSEKMIEKKIIELKNVTVKFCKSNPNVIFTRADKGNVTVAIDKTDYLNKIETMLQDQNTYMLISKDPMKNIEKCLNTRLKKWLHNNYITKQTYFSLFSSDSALPKAYGLPKIHKKNYPYRIIVSSINTALYKLASFLQSIITSSLPHDNRQVKNSFELYETLSGKRICNTHKLISLDVVSLFTNIPQDLAINSVTNRWTSISKKTGIPKEEFIEAIVLVLSSTFFVFNKKIYKQTYGTPMGSPLSPVIAYLVLQDLEEKALGMIDCDISFYYRYVDDIILAAPNEKITKIVEIFNSFHDRLQFTVEYENNRTLNFMDLLLCVVGDKIVIDWFHKETFSGRFLSFYSNHPMCHKIGIIFNLIDRAILLSHPKHHQKNIEICIDLLLDNGYPLDLIFDKIDTRIKKIFLNKVHSDMNNSILPNKKNDTDLETNKKFFVIPYMCGISETVASLFNKSVYTVGFKGLNKLDKIVRVQKDYTEHSHKNNVVYKINCKNCDASYVGQTKRQIRTRIKEHYNNIKTDKSKHSVITEHIINFNHNFDWDNIKIMDTESNYNKRLVSEMLHIKEQKNGINLHKDTELLDESYSAILSDLSK